MTRTPVRILVGGLVAGLAVTGTAFVVLQDSEPTASDTLSAQAEALPSAVALPARTDLPARTAARASRGGARTAALPTKLVTKTVATGSTFSGEASWYGGSFQGQTTANGESFNTYAMTAASKTLPFGTRLRVCRQSRCVVVRINDRGPYAGGRVLDLSQAAAQQLGYSGVAHVTATPVGVRTVAVIDTAAVARQKAVQQRMAERRAAVARRQAARNNEIRADRARDLADARLAAASSGLEPNLPVLALAGGLVLASSTGLVHARRRRTHS